MPRTLKRYIEKILSCNGTGAQELSKLVQDREISETEASIIRLRVAVVKLEEKTEKMEGLCCVHTTR